MNLGDLFKPFMPILEKATSVEINSVAAADFIDELLGDKEHQKKLQEKADAMIKGGAIVEAVDGSLIGVALDQLRKKAEELRKKESEENANPPD